MAKLIRLKENERLALDVAGEEHVFSGTELASIVGDHLQRFTKSSRRQDKKEPGERDKRKNPGSALTQHLRWTKKSLQEASGQDEISKIIEKKEPEIVGVLTALEPEKWPNRQIEEIKAICSTYPFHALAGLVNQRDTH